MLSALGFELDVIHWTNRTFTPRRRYDLFVDVRLNLERLGPLLGPDCLKVMHIETAHCYFYNPAQRRRLAELEARRGHPPGALQDARAEPRHRERRRAPRSWATSDPGDLRASPASRSGRCRSRSRSSTPSRRARTSPRRRRRFLWFGSGGLLHKGLDRVLEVFAGLPELSSPSSARSSASPSSSAPSQRELYRTPNIHTHGWIDVASPEFLALARRTLALVYPSCSEGQNGGAVTCMHAGLIPVLSRESGVDLDPDVRHELLAELYARGDPRRRVLELAGRPGSRARGDEPRRAWEWVRAHHTRERSRADTAQSMLEILERFRPALARKVGERGA